MPAGRPSKLTPQVEALVSRAASLGLTDKQLAGVLNIDLATLHRWKKDPKFCDALKIAKELSDEAVERSLWERANGYSVESVKIFCSKDGEVTQVPYIEHYPPDPTSMIFWLKNRQPKKWRDRQEITGADGAPINININLGNQEGSE